MKIWSDNKLDFVNIIKTSEKFSSASTDLNTIREREQQIQEYETQQKLYHELKEKNTNLNQIIQTFIDKEQNQSIKELFQYIQNLSPDDEDEFTEKEWFFNNGQLRTQKEINTHIHELREQYYAAHPEVYNSECKSVNTKAFIIPFGIVFILCFMTCSDEFNGDEIGYIFGIIGGLIFALIAALIGMALGHSYNLKKAKEFNIHNERVDYEKREQQIGSIATIASAIHIAHHTKKAIKEIGNPDSWKEMK